MSRSNPTARASLLKRESLAAARDLFRQSVEASAQHALELARAVKKHGERGPWISGIGQDHFPDAVKNRLRKLAQQVTHYSNQAWIARPPRVRDSTMRELAAAVANRYGHGFYGPQPNPSGDTSRRRPKRRNVTRRNPASRYRAIYRVGRGRQRRDFNARDDAAAVRYATGLLAARVGAECLSCKRIGAATGAAASVTRSQKKK